MSQKGDFEEIIAQISQLGTHLPGPAWDIQHTFYFAFAHLKLKQHFESLESWNQIIEQNPDHWKAHYFRGLCLSAMDNYLASIDSLQICLQINPKYFKAWFQLGNSYLFLQKLQEAEERYTACINLNKDFLQAWTNLGNCHLQTGKFERAIECYDVVLERKPDSYIAWYNKGYASDELGHDADAVYCFQKCLDLKEDYVKGWFNLAVIQSKLGLFDLALSNFETCLELDPGFVRALNDKGYLLNKMRRLDEALGSFKRAQEINPKYPDCLNGQAMILKKQGRLDEALSLLNKSISMYRSFIRAYINRADLYRRLEDIEQCKSDLQYIELMLGSQTHLDKICHTPKKFLELRYFTCYKSLLEVCEYLDKSQTKTANSNTENFETYISKMIDQILKEEINDIASMIDMKSDIALIEGDIKDIQVFLESKKYIFEHFRNSNLSKPIGSVIYKKRLFELILKHKKQHLSNEEGKKPSNKKLNKFYEWFFRSWNQKFENAVSLTNEFIKQELSQMSSSTLGSNAELEDSVIFDDIKKADMHYQKFLQILVNAEHLMEGESNFKDVFQSDVESFGFASTQINFARVAKIVIKGK